MLISDTNKTHSTSSSNGDAVLASLATREAGDFSFLKPIKFRAVSFWDFAANVTQSESAKHKFNLVKLGNLLEQRKGFFTIDEEQEYKRCKVQLYAKGVVLRDVVKGKDIKTKKQQACKTNDFLVAEIDAKVGGYGIVPSELENAVVSSHYYLYEIDQTKLLPAFLGLYVKTEEFAKQVKATGSTNYASIRPAQVLDYEIPLPPIATQENLVAAYNAQILQADIFAAKAKELEAKSETYLLKELGIKIQQTEKNDWQNFKFLQPATLKELSRWSVDFLDKQDALDELRKCKFAVVRFEELINHAQYGISAKVSVIKQGVPMLRMNNIFEGELSLNNLKYVSLPGNKIQTLLLQKNDFLFNRTNSKELVGKTAIFDVEGEYVFASYLIRLKLNQQKANAYFVNYLFNSSVIRKQIDIISRQVLGQANVNLTELKSFLVPLPSLRLQNKIVKHINSLKAEIKKSNSAAEELRRQAKGDFASAMFDM